ncbi:MAG: RdgB/HAM1 family non-canonical purine NTP pyrophosphatase [Halieaceae bacterium]|jgi:XTP/dITP diphosphohydrolase|nr:RdgB/HAM1 family non-canonical purine NTP pyrophosphatase [Halieaceae bacterium]
MSENIVLASGNPGKLAELQHALSPLGWALRPQSDWQVPEAEETACTFVENALIKARHAAEHTGLAAIADDSGLVVPALGGDPGIRSARYSGGGDAENNALLLERMALLSGDDRKAFFIAVVVLLRAPDDPTPVIAEGRWHGRIATQPCGDLGFGYDPLFVVEGDGRHAAELSKDEKTALSHRGIAIAALRSQLGA